VPDARPTIAQIIPQLDAGGAELTTLEVTQAIVMAGGRALVLSQGGRLAAGILAAGGEIIPFPAASKNPLRILGNVRRLKALAARERVSLLHVRSRAPAWSALLAARSLGLTVLPARDAVRALQAHGSRLQSWRRAPLRGSSSSRGQQLQGVQGLGERALAARPCQRETVSR